MRRIERFLGLGPRTGGQRPVSPVIVAFAAAVVATMLATGDFWLGVRVGLYAAAVGLGVATWMQRRRSR